MAVPQYTTPTFTLTFTEEALDLTQVQHVYVTFKSHGVTVTKTGEDLTVEEKSIQVFLSQEETAQFIPGALAIQANWLDREGNRWASDIINYDISEQLLKKVIP